MNKSENALQAGHEVIKSYAETLDHSPGVYRMLSENDEVLYVGKARSLKNRVSSYARPTGHNARITRMIAQTAKMMFITTQTETEALLLEQNLIKQLKPRYNILLRDDKSFPEILIRLDHDFPQILRHRGAHKVKGHYYGPFASGSAVARTLHHLERAFLLRTCTDGDFSTRSRPCLQYQIKRCSGPCVGKISHEDYMRSVEEAAAFMDGKSNMVQKRVADEMQKASLAMEYERAGALRDRLSALSAMQQSQSVNPDGVEEADIIALAIEGGVAAIQIFFIRNHQNWGNHAFYPKIGEDDEAAEILNAFLLQFYDRHIPPKAVLISDKPHDCDLIAEMLSAKLGRNVSVNVPQRGEKLMLVGEALRNARESVARKLSESAKQSELLRGLSECFDLLEAPRRVEVYDNSHIQGAHAVGAMIVAGEDGFLKSHYRKYNIKSETLTPGDDFGMMKEVLARRFRRLASEENEENIPDLLLIDGGAGQVAKADEAMREAGLEIPIIGVAKGVDRDAGREEFYRVGLPVKALSKNDPVLHFIQRLRDEAHRFAIGTHRKKRSAAITENSLDHIPGIGAARKRALLHHFGSAKAVRDARVEDLKAIDGISKQMAEVIYGFFHPDGG